MGGTCKSREIQDVDIPECQHYKQQGLTVDFHLRLYISYLERCRKSYGSMDPLITWGDTFGLADSPSELIDPLTILFRRRPAQTLAWRVCRCGPSWPYPVVTLSQGTGSSLSIDEWRLKQGSFQSREGSPCLLQARGYLDGSLNILWAKQPAVSGPGCRSAQNEGVLQNWETEGRACHFWGSMFLWETP